MYGAHTTASDALWMWVPLLSLEGYGSSRMPSRVASAITNSVLSEIESFIGTNPTDGGAIANVGVLQSTRQYEDMAVRLLKNVRAAHTLHSHVGRAALRSA